MKEKYKKLEIDEDHMKQTIELSKLKLKNRQAKYEESSACIWWSFFKKESMKYMIISLACSCILCLLSFVIEGGYAMCTMNAALIGTIVLYDDLRSSMMGMEELLMCAKLNPAKIFVYKSNIYLLMALISTFLFNLILSSFHHFDFMVSLFCSLIPMYLISAVTLIIVDQVSNKLSIIIAYISIYAVIAFEVNQKVMMLSISNKTIIFLLAVSFGIYCLGIYIHLNQISKRKGYTYGIKY